MPQAVCFFCPLILAAPAKLARGELLRSRSLKRPPLVNLAVSGYEGTSKKSLPGTGGWRKLDADFDDWEATKHGKIV